jgi:hypothetical protein
MTLKCSKWASNICTFSNLGPYKIYPNWFEKKPSGNPGSDDLLFSEADAMPLSHAARALTQAAMAKYICTYIFKEAGYDLTTPNSAGRDDLIKPHDQCKTMFDF